MYDKLCKYIIHCKHCAVIASADKDGYAEELVPAACFNAASDTAADDTAANDTAANAAAANAAAVNAAAAAAD